METQRQTVEEVFLQQWQLLSDAQKELLLNVALHLNGRAELPVQSAVSKDQWDRIFREQEAHLNGSKSYTWDEVKEMARNKEKRHGLPPRD